MVVDANWEDLCDRNVELIHGSGQFQTLVNAEARAKATTAPNAECSPDWPKGGGFMELIAWVAVFGVASIAMVAERCIRTDPTGVSGRAQTGALVGFLVGGVAVIAWFSSKGGPGTGDWFIGPAGAAVGVAIML